MYTNFTLSFYTHVWCSHRCLFDTYSVFILRKYNKEKSYDSSYANTNLIKICLIFKWRRRYVTRCVSCLRGIIWGQKPTTESPQSMSLTLEACRVLQESVCARHHRCYAASIGKPGIEICKSFLFQLTSIFVLFFFLAVTCFFIPWICHS